MLAERAADPGLAAVDRADHPSVAQPEEVLPRIDAAGVVGLPDLDVEVRPLAGHGDRGVPHGQPHAFDGRVLAERPRDLDRHQLDGLRIQPRDVALEGDVGQPVGGHRHRQVEGQALRDERPGDPAQRVARAAQQPGHQRGRQLVALGDEDRLGHQDLAGRVEEVERDLLVLRLEPAVGDDHRVGRLVDAPLVVLDGHREGDRRGGLGQRPAPDPARVERVGVDQGDVDVGVAGRGGDVGVGHHASLRLPRLTCRGGQELLGDRDLDRAGGHRVEEVPHDLVGVLSRRRRRRDVGEAAFRGAVPAVGAHPHRAVVGQRDAAGGQGHQHQGCEELLHADLSSASSGTSGNGL